MYLFYSDYIDAIRMAIKAHDGQYDKGGSPYILHPLHVSESVGGDINEKIVAVLHDVVEDTDITLDVIQGRFGSSVAFSIDCLTKRNGNETYAQYISRVCRDKVATKVKIADMMYNSDLSRIKTVTDKDRKMVEKYQKWLPFLMERQYDECRNCDCNDPDIGCTMPSVDKSYACPIESERDGDIKVAADLVKTLSKYPPNMPLQVSVSSFISDVVKVDKCVDMDTNKVSLVVYGQDRDYFKRR